MLRGYKGTGWAGVKGDSFAVYPGRSTCGLRGVVAQDLPLLSTVGDAMGFSSASPGLEVEEQKVSLLSVPGGRRDKGVANSTQLNIWLTFRLMGGSVFGEQILPEAADHIDGV